jgi:predicted ester cyclase
VEAPGVGSLIRGCQNRFQFSVTQLMGGTPPTGRTVAYPIATSTQVEGDKIRSEHVYLDRQTVADQLGLKAK